MASRRRRFNFDASRGAQIDRALVEVIVIDSVHGSPGGRPWMTLVIDAATQMITGYHLSLEPPSSPANLSGRGGGIEQLPE